MSEQLAKAKHVNKTAKIDAQNIGLMLLAYIAFGLALYLITEPFVEELGENVQAAHSYHVLPTTTRVDPPSTPLAGWFCVSAMWKTTRL